MVQSDFGVRVALAALVLNLLPETSQRSTKSSFISMEAALFLSPVAPPNPIPAVGPKTLKSLFYQ
jgi:hypothetical protein